MEYFVYESYFVPIGKKKLLFSQVKILTAAEKKKSLQKAEAVFGNDDGETPRKRRSIFKRDKSPDEKRDEVKRMILGQKRPRPTSISSPKSSPKELPKKVESSKTPKTDSKPPEKKSRRSTRGNPIDETPTEEPKPVNKKVKPMKEVAEVSAEKPKNSAEKPKAEKKADEPTRTRSRRSVTPAQNSK